MSHESTSIENLFSAKNMQSIVDSIRSLTHHEAVICNNKGVIVSASNKKRLGRCNDGIRQMLENNDDTMIVTTADSDADFLPGVNQPIRYKGIAVGALGITGNPDEVQIFCRIVRSFVQQQLKELDREKNKANRKRMLSTFVYSWVFRDSDQDTIEFETRARALDVDLRATRVICVLSGCNTNKVRQNITADQINSNIYEYLESCLGIMDKQHIVSPLGREIIVLLNSESTSHAREIMSEMKVKLKQNLAVECAIGIGSVSYNQEEIRLSYEAAKLACNTSCNTPNRDIMVFELFDLNLLISTVDRRHKQRAFNYVFRNYEDSAQIDECIILLQCYINSNRSIDQTAETLCMHRNTVQYRLNKIQESTGYNPRNARDLTFLHTIVLIYKMGIRRNHENFH